MKIELFFDPVSEAITTGYENESMGDVISAYSFDCVPDWKEFDIALITINEYREGADEEVPTSDFDLFRKVFYRLSTPSSIASIVDLGTLRSGPTVFETCMRLKEVCSFLIQENTIPVIIGGQHLLDYGQFLAYEGIKPYVRMCNVDASIDMDDDLSEVNNQNHIRKIVLHEPNILLSYSHVGYQSYFVKNSTLENLERFNFETYRLGEVRDRFEETEPVIRNCDLLSFDLHAIKEVDAAQPFGLTGEEACRLCWYAGLNHTISSFGIYNYRANSDQQKNTTIVATMLWYFIDGYYNRKGSLDFTSSQYTKYVVDMSQEPGELIFYKHKASEKWWMEVQYFDNELKKIMSEVVPCSYADFETANRGEIPHRWLLANARLA